MGDVIEILTTATNTVEVEAAGPQGIPGVGVPTGGSALQVLRKKTGTDYDTEWATGGGGASYDQSLNTTDSVTFESVTADKVAFDLTAAETAAQGELAWNADEETLDLGLAHGSVLQVGQETLYHVENSTASTITAGTLCVFSGTVGNSGKLRVAPHANNTNPTAIIGIATSTIAAGVGEEGYVTHFGKCRGINASGGAEAWANGDLLYASSTGGLTNTKPSAPIVTVAAVVSNSSSSGTLFVRPSFGQTAADVGAQSSQAVEAIALSSSVTLTASRNKLWKLSNNTVSNYFVELPTTGISVGDIVEIEYTSSTGRVLEIRRDGVAIGQSLPTITRSSYRADTNLANGWTPIALNYSNAGFLFFTQGDVLLGRQGTSGQAQEISCSAAGRAILDDADAAAQRTTLGLGTAATSATGDFAASSHSHGNINSSGQIGTTSGLPLVTTTAGAVSTLALGAAGQVLTVNSGANGVEFAAAAGGGVTGASASASDVLGVSGANITGVDANADRIVFWDDSASKLAYLEAGSGLSLSGTTLTATATGTIGGSTGATDNLLLRSDGTGAATLQNSALQLDDATTSTQANVALINAHSETNSAIVLTPKGTGAFIVGPKPDGTSTGGNARGLKAVDLSHQRSAAGQVASGNYSMVLGGDRCVASNICTIAAGETAVASGQYAVALGRSNTANNTASAAIGGQSNTASGQESFVAGGDGNNASAYVAAAFGNFGLADRSGLIAQANGRFAANGDAQWIHMVLRAKTTTNTAVELLINNGRVTNGRLTCPSGKVISGIINIHGVKSDGTASAHFVRQFQVKNVGGTSSYPYTAATIGTDYASSTSITFNDPDTNGDALSVSVTGIASETWRWTAHVSAVETTYGT